MQITLGPTQKVLSPPYSHGLGIRQSPRWKWVDVIPNSCDSPNDIPPVQWDYNSMKAQERVVWPNRKDKDWPLSTSSVVAQRTTDITWTLDMSQCEGLDWRCVGKFLEFFPRKGVSGPLKLLWTAGQLVSMEITLWLLDGPLEGSLRRSSGSRLMGRLEPDPCESSPSLCVMCWWWWWWCCCCCCCWSNEGDDAGTTTLPGETADGCAPSNRPCISHCDRPDTSRGVVWPPFSFAIAVVVVVTAAVVGLL